MNKLRIEKEDIKEDLDWLYINLDDYSINQLSKYTWHEIENWALGNDVTLKAWEEFEDIFENVVIGH